MVLGGYGSVSCYFDVVIGKENLPPNYDALYMCRGDDFGICCLGFLEKVAVRMTNGPSKGRKRPIGPYWITSNTNIMSVSFYGCKRSEIENRADVFILSH